MELTELRELMHHPERMDRNTLYELRSLLALYPYFQTARLLMLQNLYLLHDTSFDEELRRAAVYVTDRKVIFQMVEAAHYQLHKEKEKEENTGAVESSDTPNRTIDLIDSFLDNIPEEDEEPKEKRRRPTPADAAVDYVAYLLATEQDEKSVSENAPQMKGQSLIDHFLEEEQGRILLSELPADDSKTAEGADDDREGPVEEEYFTETLARIYIRQGRYQKALDILSRLSGQHPEKNVYFADQIRFLEKLIINSSNNSKK